MECIKNWHEIVETLDTLWSIWFIREQQLSQLSQVSHCNKTLCPLRPDYIRTPQNR